MTSQPPTFPVHLFYSYCHKDNLHRENMEQSLASLKTQGLLKSWSDQYILPGQSISKSIKKEMDKADIIVFLLSKNFIKSVECMKEWENAKQLAAQGKLLFRIPIILEDCLWQKMLVGDDDVKALPKDGKPVVKFTDNNDAWQQVRKGIKAVVDQLRNTFTPKPEFFEEIQKTIFLSQQHIKLKDIFVFLSLSCYTPQTNDGQMLEEKITSQEQLLKKKYALVHGEEMSGKTALGRHLFLSLVEKSNPVLHVDLEQVSGKPTEKVFYDTYRYQFNGDYSLWKKQANKTLILDNLSSAPNLVGFVVFAKNFFERIIVTLSSDIFHSFFRDESRLADFCEMKIGPLTHKQQEELIRKRLILSDRNEPITDGIIDQIEQRINSIITYKIVPRYPFFVLSILQTYEAYMPSDLSITAYGHCYYALIVANLTKTGISKSDDEINTCFNFAENLAFEIYQNSEKGFESLDFNRFVKEYIDKYIISDSILNRLKHRDYGILTKDGRFKTSYMHYFFLGRFLSKNRDEHKFVIEKMCNESHMTSNHLTLLFIIHHTNDNQIIDDILLGIMCTLDSVQPAQLNLDETKRFGSIVAGLNKNILSNNSVESERGKERDARDVSDRQIEIEEETEHARHETPVNDCYRILKNNEILGQVLRNKCGNLEKVKLEEIIEIVADSGLRLVNFVLGNEKEIADVARYIQRKYPKGDISKIKSMLQFISFIWTMVNVEKIVDAINHPEIKEVVTKIVRRKSTPAYDLIGYFSQLDSAAELTPAVKQELAALLKEHKKDPFLKGVLSIRTQRYMNTHRSKANIEQSVCSSLGIKYTQKYVEHK